jgi:hypothetical protein
MAKTGGYFISPIMGVHSTFRNLPMSSCFGQYTWSSYDVISMAKNEDVCSKVHYMAGINYLSSGIRDSRKA